MASRMALSARSIRRSRPDGGLETAFAREIEAVVNRERWSRTPRSTQLAAIGTRYGLEAVTRAAR
jgi:hypothetical protein